MQHDGFACRRNQESTGCDSRQPSCRPPWQDEVWVSNSFNMSDIVLFITILRKNTPSDQGWGYSYELSWSIFIECSKCVFLAIHSHTFTVSMHLGWGYSYELSWSIFIECFKCAFLAIHSHTFTVSMHLRRDTFRIAWKPRGFTNVGQTQKEHDDAFQSNASTAVRLGPMTEGIDVGFNIL